MAGSAESSRYATVRRGVGLLLRAFFHRVDVVGAEHVPADRGGLFVSWHPNALVDPALMLVAAPRPLVFGARHGLFAWPVLGWILRALGTVPIRRAQDGGDVAARRAENARSLDLLAGRIAAGGFSALFPEGDSHDGPDLLELKTGAARLWDRARALRPAGAPPPAIVPVGLHYDRKHAFRSSALVWLHRPIELPPALAAEPPAGESEKETRRRHRAITAEIEAALREVVLATADWDTHRVLHRGRKLIRAERAAREAATPDRPGIEERTAGFAAVRAAYDARRRTHPRRVAALRARVERYDRDLRSLRLDDHDLDRAPRLVSPWLVGLLLLQAAFVFLLLPPVLLVGSVVNLPAAGVVVGMARLGARRGKDLATLKILFGAALFPLVWIGAGVAAAFGWVELHEAFPRLPAHPAWTGAAVAALAAAGGVLSVRYVHVARLTWRALRIRLTRFANRDQLRRLLRERAELFDAMMQLALED